MAVPYLVVDMQKLLDGSDVGHAAAAQLEARFKASQAEHQKLKDAVAGAKDKAAAQKKADEFEKKALADLAASRAALRGALLRRAQPIMEEAMKAANTTLVLERSAVIMFDLRSDITTQLIMRVDALGPLKE
jgi:Skp family chaperone for outer membrane proteins